MANQDEKTMVIPTFAKGRSKDYVNGKSYVIEARTVRFNSYTLNEWCKTGILNDRENYETWEEWDAYRNDREKARKILEKKIAKIIGLDTKKAVPIIANVAAEIFTIVQIWEDKPGACVAPEAAALKGK